MKAMMKQFFLLFFILLTANLYSQEVRKYYTLIEDASFIYCDENGTEMEDGLYVIPSGTKFNIEKVMDADVILTFPEWKHSTPNNNAYVYGVDASGLLDPTVKKYYKLSKVELFAKARPTNELKESGAILGIVTTPIKIRFGNSDKNRYADVTSDVSLGLSAGYKHQIKPKTSIGATLGISLTSIKMTAENNDSVSVETNVSALTIPLSIILFQDDFQVGISIGYDIPWGSVGAGWKYRNSPYIGIGLGYNIFQLSTNEKKQTN